MRKIENLTLIIHSLEKKGTMQIKAINSPRKKQSLSLLPYFLLGILTLSACGSKELSSEYPYAVEAKAYRSWHKANALADRISSDGMVAKVICTDSPDGGRWYRVVVGAIASHSEAMALKIKCEDAYGLDHVTPVTMDLLDSLSCQSGYANADGFSPRVNTQQPVPSKELIQFLSKLPYLSGHTINKMSISNFGSGLNPTKLSWAKGQAIDIPRGVSYQELYGSVEYITEIHFQDEFRSKQFNLQVYQLKKEGCSLCMNEDLPQKIASRIVGTREYELEKVDSVRYHGENSLNGYAVTITPRPNRPKHYLILTDKLSTWLYVIQSPDEDINGMQAIAQVIAKGESDISLHEEFYNSFTTLPVRLNNGELLSYYQLEMLESSDKRSGARFEGCFRTRVVINNLLKGILKYEMVNMLDSRNIEMVFQDRNELANTWVDTIQLYGTGAAIQYVGKHKSNKKRPKFLRFATPEEYGVIYNYSKQKVDSLDLLITAQKFQLGMGRKLSTE